MLDSSQGRRMPSLVSAKVLAEATIVTVIVKSQQGICKTTRVTGTTSKRKLVALTVKMKKIGTASPMVRTLFQTIESHKPDSNPSHLHRARNSKLISTSIKRRAL